MSRRRRHWEFLVRRPDGTTERVPFYARTKDEATTFVTAWGRRMGFELLEGAGSTL
ncbi:MAG: hypothetical protein H0U05_00195 [Actinobacteria bacterium]|nr:hypothetical protein [Actinomycetota bacterium]